MRKSVLIVTMVLSGCAYQPIVDHKASTHPERYGQDLQECQAYAQQVAGPGTGAAAGATAGFVLGTVICKALGGRDCSSSGRAGRK